MFYYIISAYVILGIQMENQYRAVNTQLRGDDSGDSTGDTDEEGVEEEAVEADTEGAIR